MKDSPIASAPDRARAARPFFNPGLAALLAGLVSVSLPVAVSHAQPDDRDRDGEEVLTRGPVHEAFAGVISFNPEPGIVVRVAPPGLIEELPPAERPEGDDVAWIPGYWGWDDERNDYLWISGTWRVLPPGREWMAGYWRETGPGYQWISGYWSDATEQDTTYLPPPPQTLEVGPNVAAPSTDYGWTPGCWIWFEGRYAWRAGYWAEGYAEWLWIPASYVWTPRGYIYVDGYWDYPVARRGLLFAPVYYHSRGYARRGYSYSPRIVISLSFFSDNLFLRPSYHHYYFGDYYDSRYEQGGFFASYSYQSSRRGYDPFYSYGRWEHRSDRDWDNRYQSSYRYRRENVAARPPRTWSTRLSVSLGAVTIGASRVLIASPLELLARNREPGGRFQAVAQGDRQRLAQRGRQVQEMRDQRRSVEAGAAVAAPGRNAPARVAVPRSPIVARPAEARGRNQSPPAVPPSARRNPADQPRVDNRGRQAAPGSDAPADRRAAERNRDQAQRQVREEKDSGQRDRAAGANAQVTEKSRQQADERTRAVDAKTRDDSSRKEQEAQQRADEAAARSQQQARERPDAAAVRVQQDTQQREQRAQQQAEERGRAAEQQTEDRAKAAAAKDRDDAQRKEQQARQRADESAARSRQQAEERGKAVQAQENSKRQDQPPQAKAAQDAARRAREAEAAKAKAERKDRPTQEEDDEAKKEKDKDPRRGG
jgi:hypothetical protein